MAKKSKNKDNEWQEAKRRCHLSDEDVRMAKELGFRPRSLIKNIPSKSQRWKAPVREWIRDLYAKRFPDRFQEPDTTRLLARPDPLLPEDVEEDLLPQYDTVTEEPCYRRDSDGQIFSCEEAGAYFLAQEEARHLADTGDEPPEIDEEPEDLEDLDFWEDREPSAEEIDSQDAFLLRRQQQFRIVAEAVAAAMGQLSEVQKVVLFGSVAKPLEREVPRFRQFRRARIETWHECKDVDLAVWISSLTNLTALQKARSRALNELLAKKNIGVAHHQVDVFLLEPQANRYLGRLCCFGQCPKGKEQCRVEGCGRMPFLQQHDDFTFDWAVASQQGVVLYEKTAKGA